MLLFAVIVFIIVVVWVIIDHILNKHNCDLINEYYQNNIVKINNQKAYNQARKKPRMVNGYPMDYNNNYNQTKYNRPMFGYKPAKTGIGVFLAINLVVGLLFALFVGVYTSEAVQFQLDKRSRPPESTKLVKANLVSYTNPKAIDLINDGTIQSTNGGLILSYVVVTSDHDVTAGYGVYINCQKYFDNLSPEKQAEYGSARNFMQLLIDNEYIAYYDTDRYINEYLRLSLFRCYPRDADSYLTEEQINKRTFDFAPLPPEGTNNPFRTQLTTLFNPTIELVKPGDINHLPEYDVNFKIDTSSEFYQQLKSIGCDVFMEIYETDAIQQELSDTITTNVTKTYSYVEPYNVAKDRFIVSDIYHIEDVSGQEFNIKTPYEKTINAYLSVLLPNSYHQDILALGFFLYTGFMAITYFSIKHIYINKYKNKR